MKKIVFCLIALFLIFSGIAFSEEKGNINNDIPANGICQDVPASTHETLLASANCYAYTICPAGYRISCRTYGAGCTWYVQPGRYVECTGYNQFGQYVNIFETCF